MTRQPVGRITVVEHLYHYADEQSQPTSIESIFTRHLKSDEQPYIRILKLTEDWIPLDKGWVEEVGTIVIKNMEGTRYTVNPTDEERKVVESRIVEIGYHNSLSLNLATAFQLVPPQESSGRITPADWFSLRVRCRSGVAKITLTVYPA